MQTPIDLLSLAGKPREAVAAVIPLDDEDGVEAWGPFYELVAHFGEDGRLLGGHVFFTEPHDEERAQALLAGTLSVQPGERCTVALHPCVHRPEIISASFTFTA